jgi:ADP-ribosylglycohydrolase
MIRDILYGIAVGDAVGNPLEFMSRVTHDDFRASAEKEHLRVSDDTQMTLFCHESLQAIGNQPQRAENALQDGYLRWFKTQTGKRELASTGLFQFESMYSVEAPGRTCIDSLRALAAGRKVENDSKGNGTVMRCAPIAFWAHQHGLDYAVAYEVASKDALLTHKHPMASLSSVLLTGIHLRMMDGMAFQDAVEGALSDPGIPLIPSVERMLLSALSDPAARSRQREELGGWVAEEALALAVGAVAGASEYMDAIRAASCIGGDSDTVAGIAGGFAAATGMLPPAHLCAKINVRDAIESLI